MIKNLHTTAFHKLFFLTIGLLLCSGIWNHSFAGGSFAITNSTSINSDLTVCNGSSPTLSASFGTTNCGGGPSTATNVDVSWYYNTTGATGTLAGATQLGSTATLTTGVGGSATFSTSTTASVTTDLNALLTTNGTYYIFCVLSNPANTGCGFGSGGPNPLYSGTSGSPGVIQVTVEDPSVNCHDYCSSSPNSSAGDYISNVTFNTINNTTTGDSYSTYFGTCTTVNIGQTYQVCVTVYCAGTEYVWAYFDWNNDGDFSDAGEAFFVGSTNVDGTVLCTDITIPAGATGDLAMRIIESWNGNPVSPYCSVTSTYGEIEDYCVSIAACTTTVPDAGTDQTLASCATSATFAGNTITQGTGTWTLINGSGIIADPSNPTSGVTSLGIGDNTFVWSVEDAPCPTLTDTVVITTVNSPTPALAGDDIEACVGGTFDMSANSPGAGETGAWSCTGGACGSLIGLPSTDPNQSFSLVGAAGTTATLTWTLDNGTCQSADDVVLTVINDALTANAGADIPTACEGTSENLAAVAPTNGVGTWSTTSSANISDPSSETSAVSLLLIAESPITMTWTVSASGCTSVSDNMIITVNNCDPNTTMMTCGVPETFTDGAGDYANDEHIVQTYCTDDPGNQFVEVTFTSWDIYSGLDYMTVIDGDGEGDPFIGTYTTTSPGTITSSNADGCLTFVFFSNASNVGAGWTADVNCTATAGSNTPVCNDSDCQGGCGRTICGDGTYEWAGDGISVPELSTANNDCLNANEQCNVWYYLNPASAGTLSLDIISNGGQDQDFAVWQGYNSTLDCPSVSQEQPIRCNWVAMSANGTGFNDLISGSAWEPSLNISQSDIDNGIYYMVLINTYNSGGACPQSSVELTFGGTATLTCDPLGVTIANVAGKALEDYNYIYWETMNEYNCESFTVERSKDGLQWTDVGTTAGAGNSDRSLYYSMKDYNRFDPVSYYRLRQKDFDGTIEYSKVVSVSTIKDKESWITDVFPNPANESFTFQYNGHNLMEDLTVTIYDMLGRVVYQKNYSPTKNEAVLVYTDQLEKGQYNIVFTQGEKQENQSLSIVR